MIDMGRMIIVSCHFMNTHLDTFGEEVIEVGNIAHRVLYGGCEGALSDKDMKRC